MINTLNTVTAQTKGPGHDLSPLTQQLAKRADANGDGTISSTEFSQFMQELLARLDAAEAAAHASATTPAAAAAQGVESKGAFTPPSAATSAAIAAAVRGLEK